MVQVFNSKCFFFCVSYYYYYYLSAFRYNLSFETRPDRTIVAAPSLTSRKEKKARKKPTVDRVRRASKRPRERECGRKRERDRAVMFSCCCFSTFYSILSAAHNVRQRASGWAFAMRMVFTRKVFFRSLFYGISSLCCLFRCLFHLNSLFVIFLRSQHAIFHSADETPFFGEWKMFESEIAYTFTHSHTDHPTVAIKWHSFDNVLHVHCASIELELGRCNIPNSNLSLISFVPAWSTPGRLNIRFIRWLLCLFQIVWYHKTTFTVAM